MNINGQPFVVTVYRTTGNTLQRYNFDALEDAIVSARKWEKTRYTHKVELSVILETWQALSDGR